MATTASQVSHFSTCGTICAVGSDTTEQTPTCSACGVTAPSTDTDYTLISAAHGWRLRRHVHHGMAAAEWWCPKCWADLKKASGGVVAMTVPPGPPSDKEPRSE